jgi:putative MFS transporter
MTTLEQSTAPRSLWQDLTHPAVVVGALGYFVDIYDLTLCMAVKSVSYDSFGIKGELVWYADPMNWQMMGMLLGGIFFGVLGDRLGRLATLFGSILLYSLANIANGFVPTMELYSACRFIAGIGLAGELGGCIALVSEVLSKERRGYGTALVAAVGVMGAVAAGFVAELVSWRTNYIIGGILGLCLLVTRLSVKESGMFNQAKMVTGKGIVARGNFFALFTNANRLKRYLQCIAIGFPTWFMIGILVLKAERVFAPLLGIAEVKTNRAVALFYLGLTFGDLLSGFASQWAKSRKKIVASFLVFSAICGIIFLYGSHHWTSTQFYLLVFVMGLSMGYWAVFVTIAAEQFGTNLRATVATTVPNFVRGSLVIMSFAFGSLNQAGYQETSSALILGVVCFGLAFWALHGMEETYGKDLNYQEREA